MTNEEAIKRLKEARNTIQPFRYVDEAIDYAVKTLEQEPNVWSLADAREDFTHDVYNTLDFLPTNDEANRIIDSFDRVTRSIKQEPILDKIRAEIMQVADKEKFYDAKWALGLRYSLNIIDKYKAEGSDKE